MEKKYVMTDEIKTLENGKILHRIEAIRDFGNIDKGTKGGWIEKEENLSHEGNCWLYDDARVFDDARIYDNAEVMGYAQVFGNAHVFKNARVSGSADVFGNVRVFDFANVFGDATVNGNARIYGRAMVFGGAHVTGDAVVHGHSLILVNALVTGQANISENASVFHGSVGGNVCMSGRVALDGGAQVIGSALLEKNNDYFVVGPVGPDHFRITFYRTSDGTIDVYHDFFQGNVQQFKQMIDHEYGETGTKPNTLYYNQYMSAIQCAILNIGIDAQL